MFGLEKYNYRAGKDFRVFMFESNGPKGPIQKVAKFTEIGTPIFSFGFGDYDPATGDISDTVVSNNNDTDIIMGTLGSIIYDFTNIIPDALIMIEGTSPSRVRLYQMNINKHWERIHPVFEVWGLKNGHWESFRKGSNYEALLGRRKGAFLLPPGQ